MISNYLKAFVVGSSFPAVMLYFYGTQAIPESKINPRTYMFEAPIVLGTLNIFGLYLSRQLNLSLTERYLLTSLIGFSGIMILLYYRGSEIYAYTTKEDWTKHILLVLTAYLLTYNIIIRLIESSI